MDEWYWKGNEGYSAKQFILILERKLFNIILIGIVKELILRIRRKTCKLDFSVAGAVNNTSKINWFDICYWRISQKWLT